MDSSPPYTHHPPNRRQVTAYASSLMMLASQKILLPTLPVDKVANILSSSTNVTICISTCTTQRKNRRTRTTRQTGEIGLLKQQWKDYMASHNVPSHLCLECPTLGQIAQVMKYSLVKCPTSWNCLISPFTTSSGTMCPRMTPPPNTQTCQFGRWLGESHHVGSTLCYWY